MAAKVFGVTKLRQKLRRIAPEITEDVREIVAQTLNEMAADAKVLAPVDQGDLRASIEVKISRDGLAGIVGPAVRAAEIVRTKSGSYFGRTVKRGKFAGQKIKLREANKRLLMNFYKGYWAEFGTKGYPDKGVHAQPARPFMRPAYDSNRDGARRRLNEAVNRALSRAASG
jgi:HK97 gp10 family phage protein